MERIKPLNREDWVDADPVNNIPGAIPPAKAFSQTMEEMVNVIESAGLTPSGEDLTQFEQAIKGHVKKAVDEANLLAVSNTIYQRDVGDLFFTTNKLRGTKASGSLNGAYQCNGDEFLFSDFEGDGNPYELLVAGHLPSVTYARYAEIMAEVGFCGYFALDTAAKKFKIPTITAQFLQAGTPGEHVKAGLPNITGNVINVMTYKGDQGASGALSITNTGSASTSSSGKTLSNTLTFDASRSNGIYGRSSTVQPAAVKARVMVQLANEIDNAASIENYVLILKQLKEEHLTAINSAAANAQTAADTALSDIESAKVGALGNISTAQETAVNAVVGAKTTALNEINELVEEINSTVETAAENIGELASLNESAAEKIEGLNSSIATANEKITDLTAVNSAAAETVASVAAHAQSAASSATAAQTAAEEAQQYANQAAASAQTDSVYDYVFGGHVLANPKIMEVEYTAGASSLVIKAGSKINFPDGKDDNGTNKLKTVTLEEDLELSTSTLSAFGGWAVYSVNEDLTVLKEPFNYDSELNCLTAYEDSSNLSVPFFAFYPSSKDHYVYDKSIIATDKYLMMLPGVKLLIPNGMENGKCLNKIYHHNSTDIIALPQDDNSKYPTFIMLNEQGNIQYKYNGTYYADAYKYTYCEDNYLHIKCPFNTDYDEVVQGVFGIETQSLTHPETENDINIYDRIFNLADNAAVVHTTGDEVIAGVKDFTGMVKVPNSMSVGTAISTSAISKAEKGYLELGNGIIFQWGKTTGVMGSNNLLSESLPMPFASSNYAVSIMAIHSDDDSAYWCVLKSKSTSSFTWKNYLGTSVTANQPALSWVAIGY